MPRRARNVSKAGAAAPGGHWAPIPGLADDAQREFDREFGRAAKFYADENFATFLVKILRDLRMNGQTAAEAHLLGRSDADHFAHARRSGRILLTHDRDFLNDRDHPPEPHPGVVVFDIQPLTREGVSGAFYLLKHVVRPYGRLWEGGKIVIHKDLQLDVRLRSHRGVRSTSRLRLNKGKPEEWVD